MADNRYDIVIIGSGPGGYVAAIRAAQLGLTSAVVEREKPGGVCLNVGCIPTKALLYSTGLLEQMHNAAKYGITVAKAEPDLAGMMAHKDNTVSQMTSGVSALLKANGCAYVQGEATIESRETVAVKGADGSVTKLTGRFLLLATGSTPIQLPMLPFDHDSVIDSTSAMIIRSVPKEMAVIGGGAVGLEFAAIYSRLGAKVTVFELMSRILPGLDGEIADQCKVGLEKRGIEVLTATGVSDAKRGKDGRWTLTFAPAGGGAPQGRAFDRVLVAVGRRALTANIGIEKIGVAMDKRGNILVNERMETNVPGVFAIGDCAGGKQLAHKASKEGEVAVEVMAGHKAVMDYRAMPASVFTEPEVATVGLSEDEAKAAGHTPRVGRYFFRANGRAQGIGKPEGLVKIVADESGESLLGAHIVGPDASELLAELVLAMEMEATLEDIAATVHLHPTLMEVVKEAVLDVGGLAIHKAPRKKPAAQATAGVR
jgi:dihydrolipoamide dehydrogenase